MRRLLPELPLAATLLASFLTVPLPQPHVAIATAWVALTCLHVARRRRIYLAFLRRARRGGPRRRAAATTALVTCAAVVTLSGLAQWAGLASATPWHAGSSMLLVALVAAHAMRRIWRLRVRRCRTTPGEFGASAAARGDRRDPRDTGPTSGRLLA